MMTDETACHFDPDELLRVKLPTALRALQALRNGTVPLSDETTMAAWNGIIFCHEQIEDQTISMVSSLSIVEVRQAFISSLRNLSESLYSSLEARLASAEKLPMVYRLASELGLTGKETRAFIYMVLWSDDQEHRIVSDNHSHGALARMCSTFAQMTWAEFYSFSGPDRFHMKQGLIGIRSQKKTSFAARRVPPAVVKALHGGGLSQSESMSISSPALATVLAQNEGSMFSVVKGVVMLAGIPVDKEVEMTKPRREKLDKKALEPLQMAALLQEIDEDASKARPETESYENPTIDQNLGKQLFGEADMVPFKSDLDYLAAGKEVILAALKIRMVTKKRLSTSGDEYKKGLRSRKKEAEVEYQKALAKFRLRLQMTKNRAVPMPKLERIVDRFSLSNFERFALIMLVANILDRNVRIQIVESLESRHRRRYGSCVLVGDIIHALCDGNLEKEIAARSCFYKHSPLVALGVIDVSIKSYYAQGADISVHTCSLDRLVFDYVVGLDTELAEIVESARCYSPDIQMDNVILPANIKDQVIERVENFEQFRRLRKDVGFDDIVRYGKGLVLFFHGKSGTGKTFFANALASKLNKKVILLDINDLGGEGKTVEGQKFRIIFREAQVQNALVFIDECDALLGSRESGGLRVASILHEIETFDGILILATNKPQCLDEAMHRRIALSLEFPEPDAQMRLDIWKRHIPKAMSLEKEASLEALAIEFELTGGFIKNSIFEALASAVSRAKNEQISRDEAGLDGEPDSLRDLTVADVEVTMEDLREACRLQSRADLSRVGLQRRIIPVSGLDTLVACDKAMKSLTEIVEVERVRRVLWTRWGFKDRQSRSNCVLIMGPQGCGKTHAAGCLGFETGRALQTLSMSEIHQQEKAAFDLSKLFRRAAVAGAVVVIEEGEQLMYKAADPKKATSMGMDLLSNVKEYNGLVVICVTTRASPGDAGWTEFLPFPNRITELLSYVVKLKKPKRKERLLLWRRLIPKDTPRASDVDDALEHIAQKYEMTGSRILACINRAAAAAAMRENTPLGVETAHEKSVLTAKDLIDSCEAEFDLSRSATPLSDWVRALYV